MFLDEVVSIETANQSGEYQVISDNRIVFDKVGYDDKNKPLYIIMGYSEPDDTWTDNRRIIKYTGTVEMGEQNSDIYYVFVDDRLSMVLFDLGTCQHTTLSTGAARTLCDTASQMLEKKYGMPTYIQENGDTFHSGSILSDFISLLNPDDITLFGQKEWYLSNNNEFLQVDTLYLEYYEITSMNPNFTGTTEDWSHVFVSYQYIAPSDVPKDITPFPLS